MIWSSAGKGKESRENSGGSTTVGRGSTDSQSQSEVVGREGRSASMGSLSGGAIGGAGTIAPSVSPRRLFLKNNTISELRNRGVGDASEVFVLAKCTRSGVMT